MTLKYTFKCLFIMMLLVPFGHSYATLPDGKNNDLGDSIGYYTGKIDRYIKVGRFFEAGPVCLHLLKLSNNQNDENVKAKANYLMGEVLRLRKDYENAEHYYNKAMKYYTAAKNKTGCGNTLVGLGIMGENQNLFNKALLFYLDALDKYKMSGNRKGEFAVCNNIGTIYYQLADNGKALSFYKLALSIYSDNIIDTLKYKEVLANIGAVYFDNWNYDSALFFFNKVLTLEQNTRDSVNLAKTMNSIGSVYLAKNEMDTAVDNFKLSVKIAGTYNDLRTKGSAYSNLGNLYFQKANYARADQYYDSSLAIASENNLIDILITAYYQKSLIAEAKHNYKNALDFFKLYQELQSSYTTEKGMVSQTETLLLKQEKENKILTLEKEQAKKKTLVVILIACIALLLVLSITALYVFRLKQKSKFEKTITETQKKQFQAVIEAQESERRRIAGDLHDSVGQMLSLTKLNLSDLTDRVPEKNKEIAEVIQKSIQIIDEACNEVRVISHNLMPGSLIRLGLPSAIKDLVRQLNQSNKFTIFFESEGMDERLSENVEVALYRVVQEVLNNAVKHSSANEIKIRLVKKGDMLELQVNDNGVGFDPKLIGYSKGIGWKNIYSRLSAVQGEIKVESAERQGVQVKISVHV